jgi:hypothetical protein
MSQSQNTNIHSTSPSHSPLRSTSPSSHVKALANNLVRQVQESGTRTNASPSPLLVITPLPAHIASLRGDLKRRRSSFPPDVNGRSNNDSGSSSQILLFPPLFHSDGYTDPSRSASSTSALHSRSALHSTHLARRQLHRPKQRDHKRVLAIR